MPRMTQARMRTHRQVTPSLPQVWLTAMLRVFVELVLQVASNLQMRPHRRTRDWHTEAMPAALPGRANDTTQEVKPVAQATTSMIARS